MWNPDLLSKLGAFVQAPTPFCKKPVPLRAFASAKRPRSPQTRKKRWSNWMLARLFHIPYDTPENWGTPKNSLVSFQTSVSDFPAYLGAFLFVKVKILLIGQWTFLTAFTTKQRWGATKTTLSLTWESSCVGVRKLLILGNLPMDFPNCSS